MPGRRVEAAGVKDEGQPPSKNAPRPRAAGGAVAAAATSMAALAVRPQTAEAPFASGGHWAAPALDKTAAQLHRDKPKSRTAAHSNLLRRHRAKTRTKTARFSLQEGLRRRLTTIKSVLRPPPERAVREWAVDRLDRHRRFDPRLRPLLFLILRRVDRDAGAFRFSGRGGVERIVE